MVSRRIPNSLVRVTNGISRTSRQSSISGTPFSISTSVLVSNILHPHILYNYATSAMAVHEGLGEETRNRVPIRPKKPSIFGEDLFEEFIRPREPDVFGWAGPGLRRANSCPDPQALLFDDECKLVDQQGYFLWDDLFKSMMPQTSPLSTQSTAAVLKRMAELVLENKSPRKSKFKSRSMNDIRLYSVGNNEIHHENALGDLTKEVQNLNDPKGNAGKRQRIANAINRIRAKKEAGRRR